MSDVQEMYMAIQIPNLKLETISYETFIKRIPTCVKGKSYLIFVVRLASPMHTKIL